MKVLVFTHMYPTDQHPEYGVFVQQQVASIKREGVEVDVLFVNPKNSKWKYAWSFIPFLKTALTEKYDIVHAHYVFAGIIARGQFRFPIVLTHHGDNTFYGWQAPLCRGVSRLVDRVIVVSEQIKQAIGLENAALIPCGVDFDLFKPVSQVRSRSQLGLSKDKGLVLFVGDYPRRPNKRLDLVQEAVSHLQVENPDIELVVANKQPYDSMPLFMNACDVLVLASNREGSPQVVKEAMACNLPVISVDVGDVADVLAGVEGCYLCERDPKDMAQKIRIVLQNRKRTNGRDKTHRYEISTIAKRVIQVYEEILGKSR